MKAALVEMMTVYILMLLLFQPILHDVYAARARAVELVLDSGIEKAAAAENGRFTPDIINEMKETLESVFLLDASGIHFTGTTTLTARGEYIEGTLRVRSSPRWLFSTMFGTDESDPGYIVRYAKQMSEMAVR